MKQSDIFIREQSPRDGNTGSPWWAARPSAGWLAGLLLLAAAAAAAFWLFTGTVTQSVELRGIVFPQNGIAQIKSGRAGIVSYLQVKVGESVEAGDLIAILPDEGLLKELEAARTGGAPQAEQDALYAQYRAQSLIYTPVAGRVVELADKGSHIETGGALADIAQADPYANEAEIRAYVPIETARRISKGMTVHIRPQGGAQEQQGYLPGLVSAISSYPITQADVSRELGRFYSEDNVPQEGNVVEVRVTILSGTGTAEANAAQLDINTLCSMEVILREVTPWQWLSRS